MLRTHMAVREGGERGEGEEGGRWRVFQLRTPRMIAPSSPPEISVETSSVESGKLAPLGRIRATAAHEETEQTEAHTRDQRKAEICDQRTAEAQHVGAPPREAPPLPLVVNHPSPLAAPSSRWARLLEHTVLHGGDACARVRYSGWHPWPEETRLRCLPLACSARTPKHSPTIQQPLAASNGSKRP